MMSLYVLVLVRIGIPWFQDAECAKIGIELKQTLTVVFAPRIKSKGYIGIVRALAGFRGMH